MPNIDHFPQISFFSRCYLLNTTVGRKEIFPMKLIFEASDIPERGRGLTFDDVILVPRYSEISSRKHPRLSTRVTKNHDLEIPIVSANMDTVTEWEMSCAMAHLGGLGILHRFMPAEEQLRQVQEIKTFQQEHGQKTPLSASIGVKEEGKQRADLLADAGVQIITLDIAHGDSVMMLETLRYVKKNYPHIDVIAGNVATYEATKRLIDNGADAVKVGIGPGSMCTTRIITGHGVPQLTAITLCVLAARGSGVPIIADGGVRNSGDVVKALAAGADCVMLGSMLSGTLETPGEVKAGRKAYRGMASKAAQTSWRGEVPQGMAAEGESTMVPCKGSVKDVLGEICGGIRSGMTYMGVDNIAQMREQAQFMEMTNAGMTESRPHGIRN
jgi:IMP dehydrogenase